MLEFMYISEGDIQTERKHISLKGCSFIWATERRQVKVCGLWRWSFYAALFFLHYYAVAHSTKTHSSYSGILQKRHSEENKIKKWDPFCIRLGHFSGTEQTITISPIRLVLFEPFLFPDYFQTYLTSISCYTTVVIIIVLTGL